MRFRLKNKSYVLNTKIKLVGKNGANLSIITSDINNPTSNYNLIANTITFCLSPLPAVIGDPEVIVNEYTTSALDFENGLVDKIPTTVWTKSGTADITSVNKIFGENSFETKALGDSLSTNSNIITGGATPFTIEFYALISKQHGWAIAGYTQAPLFSKNGNSASTNQQVHVNFAIGGKIQLEKQVNTGGGLTSTGNININYNEINKYTISYDGSAYRFFVNDKLDHSVGTLNAFNMNMNQPFTFLDSLVPSYSSYRTGIKGFIDNINIHDGIATKVRDYDPYEEFLVVDLAFDGENNSTKIVDNGTAKLTWTTNGTAKLSTDQKFDGFSSLYLPDFSSTITSKISFNFSNDWTVSFQFKSNVEPDSGIDTPFFKNITDDFMFGVTNNGSQHKFQFIKSGVRYIFDYITWFSSSTKIHNITIIKKVNSYSLYIDNKFIEEKNFNIGDNFSDNISLIISPVTNNGRSFIGYYKNFKMYEGVAVIPEDPTGKIQLDFDNNVIDKYGNSTWTNTGVTFNQVNSVKGSSGYFNGSSNLQSNSNSLLNFKNKNFNIEFDGNKLNNNQTYSSWLTPNGASYPSQWCELSSWNTNLQRFQNLAASAPELTGAVLNLNIWYKWQLIRNNGTVILKANDVVTGISNYTPSMNVNFSNGTGTNLIGVSSNAMNCYVDNFKSEKDYKGEIIIDKPAAHLPLETNAINTGFTPLTINSVGNPTYTTVDGKKCIKFESGKYLTINSNNIFNLGTSSDFYMEMDVYVDQEVSLRSLITNSSETNGVYIINGRCYLLFNNSYSVISDNICNLNKWTKIIIKRTGSDVYLDYDGVLKLMSSSNDFNLSVNTRLSYNTNGVVQYMSNFKMFVGTSEIPETYNDKKVLDLDFKPTRKSYLFKDNNNKCVIHPVNITQRDYQNSQYCCTFNGTDQYLQLGKNDLFNFGLDDFVINIKFKVTNPVSNEYALLYSGETNGDPNQRGGILVHTDGTVFIHTKHEGVYYYISSSNTVSFNSINNLIIYRIDGNLVLKLNEVETNDSFNYHINFNLNSNTYIGYANMSTNFRFNGTIYSVKVLRNTNDLSLLEDV